MWDFVVEMFLEILLRFWIVDWKWFWIVLRFVCFVLIIEIVELMVVNVVEVLEVDIIVKFVLLVRFENL